MTKSFFECPTKLVFHRVCHVTSHVHETLNKLQEYRYKTNFPIVVYHNIMENAVNLSFVNVLDGILVISLITEAGEND